MNPDIWLKWIAALSPLFGVGGFAAYWEYRTRIPTSRADAVKTIQGTEISVGEAWQRYALNIDERLQKMQTQYDDLYKKFEAMRLQMTDKDEQIYRLRKRVADLEAELAKYKIPLDSLTGNGKILS